MKRMNIRQQYIAVQVEKNHAHGRAMLEGIADYALAKTDWRLELVEPELLQDVSAVRKFDGLIVRVMDDVTLDEPTRGVTVAAATAVVTVPEEKTLTLGETVTYADGAKLTKKGAGTLALGGTAVVADGASASLDVSEGFVKPLAAGALAGVTLSCGANGKFLYDVPAADATGIGATGLVDPVLAEGSAFRFSVALDARPQGTLSVPVCTLAADKVAAFKAAFKFVRTTPNTGCRLVEKSAGEGRVTLVAEVYPSGLLMIVR